MTKEDSLVILFVYLIGVIASYVIGIIYTIKKYKVLRLNDVVGTLGISALSWVSLFIEIYMFYGDIIVYKQKPKDSSKTSDVK